MHRVSRRTALSRLTSTTSTAAVAAAAPAVASAKPAAPEPGPNDRILAELAEEALQADQASGEALDPTGADQRQEAIVQTMLRTPADTWRGAAAKAKAVRLSRVPAPAEDARDQLDQQALEDLERLAGEGA